MTDREQKIAAWCEAATPGPWEYRDNGFDGVIVSTVTGKWIAGGEPSEGRIEPDDPDGTFIAHSREDVPYLLSETARLRAELAAAQRRAEAAERDMRTYMERNIRRTKGVYACDLCGNGDPDEPGTKCPPGCDGWCWWTWRGPVAEN